MSKHEDVFLVGAGEAPYEKNVARSPYFYIFHSIKNALTSAGIDHRDVDGLSVASFCLPPDTTLFVAEHFGMSLNWAVDGTYGGASGVVTVGEGARAISAGIAEVIIVVGADVLDVSIHNNDVSALSRSGRDFLSPYAFAGTNGLFGLVQQRHMHEYGTTRPQLGKFAVTQRKHAQLNDNALLKSDLSMDDYLTARPIADPIHLYDCVMPCSGGGAVVLCSKDYAQRLQTKRIAIDAFGQRHVHESANVLKLEQGWSHYRDDLYDDAGYGVDNIDMVQVYDDYPIMNLIQLEDLGFCEKGDGGAFIDRTDFSLHGDLPLNTGGGQLSMGQCGAGGGMVGLVEAVQQLKGEVPYNRLVQGAKTALVSGFGLVGYSGGMATGGLLLSNKSI